MSSLSKQSNWVALTITIYNYTSIHYDCFLWLLYISLTHFWSKRCWIWFCYHYLKLMLVCRGSGNFYLFSILFCLLTETIFSSWFLNWTNESKYKLDWVQFTRNVSDNTQPIGCIKHLNSSAFTKRISWGFHKTSYFPLSNNDWL